MPIPSSDDLLDVILDSWDRNNRVLVNLLLALPPGGLEARAMPDSPSVAEMFTHIHYVRLVFFSEDAPDLGIAAPPREWMSEADPGILADRLNSSAKAVRNAVKDRIRSGRAMELHYDHPLLFLQHMIWHEGYHHGQIKLALKISGLPLADKDIGPLTWRVFINKT
jgi:uncharacterized damage-inducible protein DinB